MKETLWKGKKEESYADADSSSIKKKVEKKKEEEK